MTARDIRIGNDGGNNMLRRYGVMIFSLAILLALCTSASARYGEPLELTKHAPQADVICTGRVRGSVTGPADSKGLADITMTFHVDRVIKGNIAAGDDLKVRYRDSARFPWPPILGGYQLSLLRKDGDGYAAVDSPWTSMPVSEQEHLHYARSGDATTDLQWEILNSLKDSDPKILEAALNQSAILTSAQVQTYVAPLADDKDPDVAIAALTGLAKSGYPGPGVAYLETHPDVDPSRGPGGGLQVALMLAHPKSQDLPSIAALMKSGSVALRQIGSYMLRNSSSSAAVPYLKSALNDSDITVRYNAVMGLSSLLRDYSHAPAFGTYRTSEQKYLGYWKTKEIK